MKSDIHPQYNPVVFVDGEHEIITRSTMSSKETREIDGVEHFVVPIEISAYSHPFYTGKQKLMDTEGRVDRFLKRYNMSRDEAKVGASGEAGDDAESTDEA
ncbi:type B 50S ribosomal protein L31 [Bradymonadaceae bacterium TMQ3]|uniref:50S ribosomal protein L31 n=1 Tax=Lujinxingia sediminis TaxID=2480984 RepID=A0ABY0CR75_9DELT|nr:type B 50S ribosomal protein L31 [Bradymonadaceae bacterium TMQ3]RVU42979.1 type B 50S ribosomal protein L31 [Lujinxingia sediminis]TXC73061.1 type B 50S ribosomal protein L31 [Bradymonadales bacterium TMQ1]